MPGHSLPSFCIDIFTDSTEAIGRWIIGTLISIKEVTPKYTAVDWYSSLLCTVKYANFNDWP